MSVLVNRFQFENFWIYFLCWKSTFFFGLNTLLKTVYRRILKKFSIFLKFIYDYDNVLTSLFAKSIFWLLVCLQYISTIFKWTTWNQIKTLSMLHRHTCLFEFEIKFMLSNEVRKKLRNFLFEFIWIILKLSFN